ncbi:MAG: hypothetical protein JW760_00555 [Spirochaetales bacterium]|nr:hypothetical protein [Spirochaetales bacterium]
METHFYLSLFPMEALIASQLNPAQFGSYMATGSKKGSAERLIFAEISGDFGSWFDWNHALHRCVRHPNGDLKNSVYLSVYRVLEHTPLEVFKALYLTTQDGRILELFASEYSAPDQGRDFFIYKELCPITPLVISTLPPREFCAYMTDPHIKTYVPKLMYTDLKMIDFDNPEQTGNIGNIYDNKLDHLKECIHEVTTYKEKPNKILERSHATSFTYQVIKNGIYAGDQDSFLFFRMKSEQELKDQAYDWAKSAMIL